jgi:hypothetical protein
MSARKSKIQSAELKRATVKAKAKRSATAAPAAAKVAGSTQKASPVRRSARVPRNGGGNDLSCAHRSYEGQRLLDVPQRSNARGHLVCRYDSRNRRQRKGGTLPEDGSRHVCWLRGGVDDRAIGLVEEAPSGPLLRDKRKPPFGERGPRAAGIPDRAAWLRHLGALTLAGFEPVRSLFFQRPRIGFPIGPFRQACIPPGQRS